jgi:hypothetical protein
MPSSCAAAFSVFRIIGTSQRPMSIRPNALAAWTIFAEGSGCAFGHMPRISRGKILTVTSPTPFPGGQRVHKRLQALSRGVRRPAVPEHAPARCQDHAAGQASVRPAGRHWRSHRRQRTDFLAWQFVADHKQQGSGHAGQWLRLSGVAVRDHRLYPRWFVPSQ